jgi:ATP-binding cassette subfamily E protein 1
MELLMNVARRITRAVGIGLRFCSRCMWSRCSDHNVMELSGGNCRKVAIAAAPKPQADLLLLDEPSAYLDVEERLNMAKALRRVVEAHTFPPSYRARRSYTGFYR